MTFSAASSTGDKMKFTLTNKFGIDIKLFLEPEGTVYELHKDGSVEIELSSCVGISIDIQLQKYEDRPCLAIWPEIGDYQIEGHREFN
jgi:hypothetical protein